MKHTSITPESIVRTMIQLALWTLVFTALYMTAKGHFINDFPL